MKDNLPPKHELLATANECVSLALTATLEVSSVARRLRAICDELPRTNSIRVDIEQCLLTVSKHATALNRAALRLPMPQCKNLSPLSSSLPSGPPQSGASGDALSRLHNRQ